MIIRAIATVVALALGIYAFCIPHRALGAEVSPRRQAV
jgi:hypothetical protein